METNLLLRQLCYHVSESKEKLGLKRVTSLLKTLKTVPLLLDSKEGSELNLNCSESNLSDSKVKLVHKLQWSQVYPVSTSSKTCSLASTGRSGKRVKITLPEGKTEVETNQLDKLCSPLVWIPWEAQIENRDFSITDLLVLGLSSFNEQQYLQSRFHWKVW